MFDSKLLREQCKFCARLRRTDFRPQSSYGHQPMTVARFKQPGLRRLDFAIHGNWSPEIRRKSHQHAVKFLRCNSEDREFVPVQCQFFADDIRVGSKPLAPELMPQHDHGACSRHAVVFHGDGVTQSGIHAKHGKVISRNQLSVQVFTLLAVVPTDGTELRLKTDHSRENIVVRAVIVEVGESQRWITVKAASCAHIILPDLNQLSWLLNRRWTKQHGIHETEDRGVHANAQAERKRDHNGTGWRLAQHAEGVADILKQIVHTMSSNANESAAQTLQ